MARATSSGSRAAHTPADAGTDPLLALQATVGNRAVAQLIADPLAAPPGVWPGRHGIVQRKPAATATKKTDDPKEGTNGGAKAGARGLGTGTADELRAAEAWVRYIALRGNDQKPKADVPASYRSWIADIQAAVKGPGPIPKGELIDDDLAFGDAKAAVKFLRKEHQRLTPKAATDAFDLADIGIERGRSNTRGDKDAFGKDGATQMDEAQILLQIAGAADDEVRDAGAAGYTIPKNLKELGPEARKRYESSKGEWTRQAPSTTQQITPIDEGGLVDFMQYATETINDLRERRAADMARWYDREREALLEKADAQLRELNRTIAESRRAAYKAGDKGMLGKVQEALESVNGAIEDTKSAANIITKRVDQLNFVTENFSKAGKKLIELPTLPKGLTDVADKLGEANSKLKLVMDVLDLVGPSKTQLDAGIKYLKAVDMTLAHFGGKSANPFVKVYVDSYLGPGIRNCIASLQKIAGIKGEENRSIIDEGSRDDLVDWSVESGGLPAYQFLKAIFRTKGATPVSDEAWAYFVDHAGDLSAAVGEKMPNDRRTMPTWAARNRAKLWEAHYGAARKPREQ